MPALSRQPPLPRPTTTPLLKLLGTLDQGKGHLVLYEDEVTSKSYDHALEIIQNASVCVDSLGQLSQKAVTFPEEEKEPSDNEKKAGA